MINMPYYFSQTDNALVVEQKQQTTSADSTGEIKTYEFNKIPIKFTDIGGIEENVISEETEENFYKKAFETKSL
ncbi:MAG: hypothetical protein Q7R53_00185 [bacterium]|nr:hypothetical protein [bacterium]